MRIAIVVALALGLGGCITPAGTGPAPGGGSAVSQVQQYTRAFCAVVPTVQTVNALLVRSGVITEYGALAQQICNAIQLNPMTEGVRGGRTRPKLHGVAIRYRRA